MPNQATDWLDDLDCGSGEETAASFAEEAVAGFCIAIRHQVSAQEALQQEVYDWLRGSQLDEAEVACAVRRRARDEIATLEATIVALKEAMAEL